MDRREFLWLTASVGGRICHTGSTTRGRSGDRSYTGGATFGLIETFDCELFENGNVVTGWEQIYAGR